MKYQRIKDAIALLRDKLKSIELSSEDKLAGRLKMYKPAQKIDEFLEIIKGFYKIE
jgi:hypothetical protein